MRWGIVDPGRRRLRLRCEQRAGGFDERLVVDLRHLDEQLQRGAEIRAIPLTADFTYQDLLAEYNGRIIPLFIVGARKKLTIITTDNQVTPQPGQTVISMVLLEGALRDADTARRLQAVRADGA